MKDKICVITLTYNRPKYIKRSIESLYTRSGEDFDLYVFDDNSNEETKTLLKRLRDKYDFNLSFNDRRENVAMNFCRAILSIPKDYRYYVKFDSDIEILTDDLFKQALDVFKLRNKYIKKVFGCSPRVEGVFNYERYPDDIEFFSGHTVRYKTSVGFGCCMFFTTEIFNDFRREADFNISNKTNIKWGIDTKLYDTITSFGNFIVIEDLSVYHIDNSYGQRKDFDYFTERKRWNKIDLEEVWYMKASKEISPTSLSKKDFEKIREVSDTFEEFLSNCNLYIKDSLEITKKKIDLDKRKEDTKKEENKKPIVLKKMYRVTSPENFKSDPNIPHGSSLYFVEVPHWAKGNSRIIVELVTVTEDFYDRISATK